MARLAALACLPPQGGPTQRHEAPRAPQALGLFSARYDLELASTFYNIVVVEIMTPVESGCFAMQSGLFHRLGEYSNVGRESEKAKQLSFGICSIRSIWLQVPSFPRACPRMYRREVWVAAINLIEAHSHTLCSFRRIKL